MKLLSVSLALCALLTLSRAVPTSSTIPWHTGLCEYEKQHSHNLIGEFVPQCDANGNFLPQQCWASTGYCWCVNVITGKEIPNTKTPPGTTPVNCGLCEYEKQHSHNLIGEFVPQCDANGNFLPQQCSGSTGYCWCVNVITGKEIPNTRTPPGTTPVNCDSEFNCPNGWSRFGKRCFVFIHSPKTWAEAEIYCLFEEGNLASIHSSEESHFIQSLTRGDSHDFPETWIGGHDAVHHCFWMWSDGSKFKYENWYDDYDTERTEYCLKINYGCDFKWNYASCNGTLPFVCAKMM